MVTYGLISRFLLNFDLKKIVGEIKKIEIKSYGE